MITKIKTVLSVFAGTCLLAASLGACAQAGTERAPGSNAGQQLQNMGTQGINGNDMNNTGTQFGNMTGATNERYLGMNLGNNQGTTQGNYQGMNLSNNQQGVPDRQKADNIKSQLMNMNGVTDANVIVMGNTALVGFKPSVNTGNVNAIKSNITKRVKEIDKTITNVSVSESADIMTRMNRLGTNIAGNNQGNTIADEFNKIIDGLNTTTR